MATLSIPQEAQALNAYDDMSFIKEDHSHQMHPNDPTRVAVFPADKARGTKFEPFPVETRNLYINTPPPSPLQLFQLFLPISLVERWVQYTQSWLLWLKENEVVDSWNNPMTGKARLRAWQGTSIAEVYVWLGVLIYIGLHKERTIKSHWSTPKPGEQRPLHSIIKFMPYWKFQILHRHLRPFDYTKIDETGPLPKVFQACDEWSDHIQAASAEIFIPGSHLAIDECMIRFTGRSNETTVIKGKPIPRGFKIWVVAQHGFFIHWFWHITGAQYGAVGVELPPAKRRRTCRTQGSQETQEGSSDEPIALNSTQSVIVALANTLPKATYHIFVDNLFSSSDLFRSLRMHGHGATGTARANSGINEELVHDLRGDKRLSTSYDFNQVKVIPTADNQVNQVAWKDNRLVLFFTTVFSGEERVKRRRKKPSSKKPEARQIRRFFGDEAIKDISIPTVAAEYNDEMNHVDRGDQLRSYYAYNHPLRRGPWQALCWTFLLDVALVNSYVIQLRGPEPSWKRFTTQREWRECIYNELFNAYGQKSQSRQHYRAGDERDLQNPDLQRNHINREVNHINRKVNSNCLACQGFRQGQIRSKGEKISPLKELNGNCQQRKQTRYGCRLCNVAICNSQNCWDFYHHVI
ncbi:hypothetical protein LCI18_013891 [Fusarium solani-melongenae]|uniref:Uncharacterized protein n=1 Tax=Fusarium solani subsp. cucurbitae TaxID=2747967 RepID=A0ACD3ZP25_FUSSC|nr:hypothetical protein LCI18_013891 [Fusarium solani-melongenae]